MLYGAADGQVVNITPDLPASESTEQVQAHEAMAHHEAPVAAAVAHPATSLPAQAPVTAQAVAEKHGTPHLLPPHYSPETVHQQAKDEFAQEIQVLRKRLHRLEKHAQKATVKLHILQEDIKNLKSDIEVLSKKEVK
jgi:hypothetical protein